MSYTRVSSIVTAAEADVLRALAAESGIEGATGLWSVPLSPDGTEPATHYGCWGWIHNDLLDLLPEHVWQTEAAQPITPEVP